ncbi:MAG: hypothetical protein NTZ95_02640 [Candidatus Omnitrophica bacterium]|nr:hypothetical protein [Candidatus Omnitrophota bacterium]
MVKKALVLAVLVIFCAANFAMAADKTKKAVPAASDKAPVTTTRQMPPRPEFSMMAGKVESVDSSDPTNVRITIKNDKDGTSHTLTVMPWTNITKSTELSELKTGEAVRVMGRKVQGKEIAMGIMFGKMPTPPSQKQVPPPQAAIQAKDQAKK